ncbi:hypothetical protein [Nocardiopsis alborubida]|uniref:Uncharacterized protein n=1 Tax=Nocardiopsis alborubida TaxID=146802 RepID=A0A7X6RMV1_9ACTN|nr:hypothetical protein [Nocardiopsis alborubida]NKY96085.1 hypothetical protein [Nocardiopsis alborubida]
MIVLFAVAASVLPDDEGQRHGAQDAARPRGRSHAFPTLVVAQAHSDVCDQPRQGENTQGRAYWKGKFLGVPGHGECSYLRLGVG